MNVLDLLDALDAADVRLLLRAGDGPGPLLVTDAPTGAITDDLGRAIRRNRGLLIAIVLGRHTGHAPGACTTCGEISMVNISTSNAKARTTWPTCRMTPACPGKHVPRTRDVERTARIAAPKQATPPPKPTKARLLGPRQTWSTAT